MTTSILQFIVFIAAVDMWVSLANPREDWVMAIFDLWMVMG